MTHFNSRYNIMNSVTELVPIFSELPPATLRTIITPKGQKFKSFNIFFHGVTDQASYSNKITPWRRAIQEKLTVFQSGFQWSRGSVLAFGTQVRGFKPGRSRRIFQGEKILSTPSFGKEVKPFVPCHRFMACKRSLNVTWKSGIFRQNSSAISRPSSSSFHY